MAKGALSFSLNIIRYVLPTDRNNSDLFIGGA
jgi:hypothetical protein